MGKNVHKEFQGSILNSLGDVNLKSKKSGDAFKYYKESLKIFQDTYKTHPHIATVSMN